MGKYTVDAAFYHPAVLFHHFGRSRTRPVIQGTKAEQAVDLPAAVMTGIKLAVCVGKEFT